VTLLEFHPEAEAELLDAARWYGALAVNLRERFIVEVARALDAVRSAPHSFPKVSGDARRTILRAFPYGVVYVELRGRLVVLAIAHHAREPGYWRARSIEDGSTLHESPAPAYVRASRSR
jgi:plasmid stabilization system protein ParE